MAALAMLAACSDGATSHRLDLTVDGEGTIDPAPGTRQYAPGSSVRVTATTASGAATGTDDPISLVMTPDKALTAHFSGAAATTYTLPVASSGNGTAAPAAGALSYAAGAIVAVTATPANGATFTGWSGAATGTGTPSPSS